MGEITGPHGLQERLLVQEGEGAALRTGHRTWGSFSFLQEGSDDTQAQVGSAINLEEESDF